MKKHTFLTTGMLAAGLSLAALGFAGCAGSETGSNAESSAVETDAEGNPVEPAEGEAGEDSAEEAEEDFGEPEELIGPPRIEIDVNEVGTDFRDENDGHVLVHLTNTVLQPGTEEQAAYPGLKERLRSVSADDLTYEQDVLRKAVKACMDEYAAHSETFTTMQVGIDVTMGRTDGEVVSFMKREYSDLDGESPFWTYQGITLDPNSGSSMKIGSIVTDQELLPDLLARELRTAYPETYERMCPPPPETEAAEAETEESKEEAGAGEDAEETAEETVEETEAEIDPEPDPAVVKALRDCLKRYSGNGESLWMVTPEGLDFYFGPYALGLGSDEQILTIRQQDHPEIFKLSPVNYPEITVRNRTAERLFPMDDVTVTGVYSTLDVDKTKYPGLGRAMEDYETDVLERINARLDELEKEAGSVPEGTAYKKEYRITAENVRADINTLTFDEVTAMVDTETGEVEEEGRTAFTYDIRTGKKR